MALVSLCLPYLIWREDMYVYRDSYNLWHFYLLTFYQITGSRINALFFYLFMSRELSVYLLYYNIKQLYTLKKNVSSRFNTNAVYILLLPAMFIFMDVRNRLSIVIWIPL